MRCFRALFVITDSKLFLSVFEPRLGKHLAIFDTVLKFLSFVLHVYRYLRSLISIQKSLTQNAKIAMHMIYIDFIR